MRVIACIITLTVFVAHARAELMSETIEYRHGDTVLEGFMVYDMNRDDASLPGVLVVHEWWGHDDFAREKAKELARLGYVAFAIDMYGKGVHTDDPQEAMQLSRQFFERDFQPMRERARAGFDVLANHWRVDSDRLGAIGFCFGGTVALQLAYSGAPLKGVVCFHGSLPPPRERDFDNIAASILVSHGADDPHVPREQVRTWQQAMKDAKLDWQLIEYGGAVHSFTNPAADDFGIDGAAYDERTAQRAWRHMQMFFNEQFAEK